MTGLRPGEVKKKKKVVKFCAHILEVGRKRFPGDLVPGKQYKRMRGVKNDPKNFGLSQLLSLRRCRKVKFAG